MKRSEMSPNEWAALKKIYRGLPLDQVPLEWRDEIRLSQILASDPSMMRMMPSHVWTDSLVEACLDTKNDNLAEHMASGLPAALLTDAVVERLLRQTPTAIGDLPERMRTDARYLACLDADMRCLDFIPDRLLTRERILSALDNRPGELHLLSNHPDFAVFARHATEQFPHALRYVDDRYITRELAELMVDQDATNIAMIPQEYTDRTMLLRAIAVEKPRSGNPVFGEPYFSVLAWTERWRPDLLGPQVYAAAVERRPDAFLEVPTTWWNPELVIGALQKSSELYSSLPGEWRNRVDTAAVWVKADHRRLDYLPNDQLRSAVAEHLDLKSELLPQGPEQ